MPKAPKSTSSDSPFTFGRTPSAFLAIGHMTYDVVPGSLAIGGAASYSSITARNLGLTAKVVTSTGEDFKIDDRLLAGVEIVCHRSDQTTTFQNIYDNLGGRQQFIRGIAKKLRPEDVPGGWRDSQIVYLCPVADEVDFGIANCFPQATIGASPQGWMRQWDKEGRVIAKRFDPAIASSLRNQIDALILSQEDIASFRGQLSDYLSLAKYVLLTRGKDGATLFAQGDSFHYPAFQTHEIDPTGAGDVFAAAFLIRYRQTLDPHQATIFANCVASFAVEKEGTEGIPNLGQVMVKLKERSLNKCQVQTGKLE